MAETTFGQMKQDWKENSELAVLPNGRYTLEVLSCTGRDTDIMPTFRVVGGAYAGKRTMAGQISVKGNAQGIFFATMAKGFGLNEAYFDQFVNSSIKDTLAAVAKEVVGTTLEVNLLQEPPNEHHDDTRMKTPKPKEADWKFVSKAPKDGVPAAAAPAAVAAPAPALVAPAPALAAPALAAPAAVAAVPEAAPAVAAVAAPEVAAVAAVAAPAVVAAPAPVVAPALAPAAVPTVPAVATTPVAAAPAVAVAAAPAVAAVAAEPVAAVAAVPAVEAAPAVAAVAATVTVADEPAF